MSSGYLHARYAHALGAWGGVVRLPNAGGWALQRAIGHSGRHDYQGLYPLLLCESWAGLESDVRALAAAPGAVAFSAVLDPLAGLEEEQLRACFPDVLVRFKEHVVIDLRDPAHRASEHHRQCTRRAQRLVNVDLVAAPWECLEEWTALYRALVARHEITGLRAFSAESFAEQLRVPGLTLLRAVQAGRSVAMSLWLEHADRVYYHLAAQNADGYRAGASYALVEAAIHHFRERGMRWLDLGAGAGTADRGSGLGEWKAQWSPGRRSAWFGGRILDHEAYAELAAGTAASSFFPRYRAQEAL